MSRKICVFIGSRANYGSIKSAMRSIKEHPELELQVVAGASSLLDKYGQVVDILEKDGFMINDKVYMIVEGSNPITMAKSTGFGLSELATAFNNLKPDVVLVVGDRYEVLAAAIAASYMNIPVAHTMGGEVSGSIDESIRHAITKLAHIHFPASQEAMQRINKLGEDPQYCFHVGCPRIDEVKLTIENDKKQDLVFEGVGGKVDTDQPFIFVSQHPVTTEFGSGEEQINTTMNAVKKLNLPVIMMWPNSDAGSEEMATGIRKFREHGHSDSMHIHIFKNLPMDTYYYLLDRTACMIGNSSSIIREGSFIGTPAVLVGSRQNNRERGSNVIQVEHDVDQIYQAAQKQIKHGKYKRQTIYGDGTAGKKIADILSRINASIQKQITY